MVHTLKEDTGAHVHTLDQSRMDERTRDGVLDGVRTGTAQVGGPRSVSAEDCPALPVAACARLNGARWACARRLHR